uniref:uncharacterized protein LOC120329800 n=1 Tax=Styela clava TaxID=7725 RepID=UPI0019399738|nr:uncharacterized protein LOC120329800 [Styela clava]
MSDFDYWHDCSLSTDVDNNVDMKSVAARPQQFENKLHKSDQDYFDKFVDWGKNVLGGQLNALLAAGQSLKVVQSESPAGMFISGAKLTWGLPKARKDLKKIQVKIGNSSGEVCHSSYLHKSSKEWKIDDEKLECGKRYHATIYCTYVDEMREFLCLAGEIEFYTRPAKPKDFRITCNYYFFTLKWSTSTKNCDKHCVEIFDKDSEVLLDRKEVKSLMQACKFDVDVLRDIYLGREYKFKVTAYYKDQENPSSKKKLFAGDENGPQEVKAKLIENTNDVELTWKKPRGSSWGSIKIIYIVVVLQKNKVFKGYKTTNTKCKIDGLKPGTSCTFHVAAIDSNGKTSLWIVSNLLKKKSGAVNFYVQRRSENPATTIFCTWKPPPEAKGYKLRYRQGTDSFIKCLGKDCTEYVIRNLLPNTEYTVAIKADEDGYGPYTTPETITTGVGQVSKAWLELDKDKLDSVVVKYNEALNATSHLIELRDSSADDQPRVHTDDGLFTDMKNNCSYYAIVTPMYGREKGKETQTEEILTAPKAPLIIQSHLTPDGEHPSSVFHLSWKSQPNCYGEEVKISCLDFNDEPQILRYERESNEDGKCFLTYRCSRSGCKYEVQMRTRNCGGFSEWSKPFTYTTVPDKIANINLEIGKDQITAKWKEAINEDNYKITLYKGNPEGEITKVLEKETSGQCYSFPVQVEFGTPYSCEVIPCNKTGEGEKTCSNTELSPLLPPQDLTIEDTNGRISFSWTNSNGMSSAKIELTDFEKFKVTEITKQNFWNSDILYDGTSYKFKVWASNGGHLSKQYAHATFATAPSDVIVKENEENPETSLDVTVISRHGGPFILTINDDKKMTIRSRHAVIEDCQPATKYVIGAQSVFDKNKKTSITFGIPVTTKKKVFSKFLDRAKSYVSGPRTVSVVSGDNTSATFNDSTIHMKTGDKTYHMHSENDFKCQRLRVVQSEFPSDKFISRAKLDWDLPKAKKDVKKIHVVISNSSGQVCRSPYLPKGSNEWEIYNGKLVCGKKYHAAIYCTDVDEKGGEFPHILGQEEFYTRPAKPKDLRITSDSGSFTLKWSTSTGNCDHHHVEIFDKDSEKLLDRKEVKGLVQECKFNVDVQRDIYLGREYKFKVTAYYKDQENPSNKEKLFVDAPSNSDKNIFSKLYDRVKSYLSGPQTGLAVAGDNAFADSFTNLMEMGNKTYNEDDFKCQSLKVLQSEIQTGEFVSDAKLTWDLPKDNKALKNIQVIISNGVGPVCRSSCLSIDSKEWEIENGKLEYGERYQATVYFTYADGQGELLHSSGIEFVTCSNQPEAVTCTTNKDDSKQYLDPE